MKQKLQKTGVLIVIFLLSIQMVSAQKADTAMINSSKTLFDLYTKRHKTFNTVGWSLLGTGSALIIIGLAEASSGNLFSPSFDTGAALGSLGVVMVLGSLPCFIIAGSNEKKAILQLRSGYVGGPSSFNYAAVRLTIRI